MFIIFRSNSYHEFCLIGCFVSEIIQSNKGYRLSHFNKQPIDLRRYINRMPFSVVVYTLEDSFSSFIKSLDASISIYGLADL